MKAILSLVKRDIIRSLRDNILLYVILSPILLAVIALFILPRVINPDFHLIVQDSLQVEMDFNILPSTSFESIEFSSISDFEEMLSDSDSSIGIYKEEGKIVLLLSEDTAKDAETYLNGVLIPFINGETIEEEKGTSGSIVQGYVLVFLLMMTMMLGGMVAGFLIVDERSGKALLSTAISPVDIKKYIVAKSFISFIIPFLIGVVVNFILIGIQWNLSDYSIVSLGAIPFGLLFGLIMGYVADNQISALGIVKLLMPVFLTLPVISMFVPRSVIWIFYIFPNFWIFESLKFVYLPTYFNGFGILLSSLFSLILGISFLIVFLPKCARRFGLK